MKLSTLSILSIALGVIPATAAITVDGTRNIAVETEYQQLVVQTRTSNWGNDNFLGNLHAAQTGKFLNLFVAGRANGNAIIVFVDSKSGGVSTITNDLIRSGGFENDINNLGTNTSSGMTFEGGFSPDYAIRIYGGGTGAFASIYDLQKRFRKDLGQVDGTTGSHGPVSAIRVSWSDLAGPLGNAVSGAEIALNMALLGVPEGAQDVKLMAMLVNGNSTSGSNQVLGPLATANDMGAGVNAFNFGTEIDTQTLTFSVNRPALVNTDDEDGDGITNGSDPAPLDQTRNIHFSVNMSVQKARGLFNPPSAVRVIFFTGSQPASSNLVLTDGDGDLIYTGTLAAAAGFQGESFGTYKFNTTDSNSPNGGFEFGFDRTFDMGAPGTALTPATVFFGNDSVISYEDWKNSNSGGQSAGEDFDGDGIDNGVEYFMGTAGNAFTASPSVVAGAITWPRSTITTINSFKVEVSTDLSFWQNAADVYPLNLSISGSQVAFTLPPGQGKIFSRLSVTP